MKSLAIIITHPIQYYAPLFSELSKHCVLEVFYTWGEEGASLKYDPGFQQKIVWDLPLLEGYPYQFVTNVAKDPGSHHFMGIVNPDLKKKIIAFNPSAILIYGWAYQSHFKVLRYFKDKIPVWFRGDSNLIDEQKGLKRILRGLFLHWIYQHVDMAFYVGTANKAYYEKFGLKSDQLIFAPHAIGNDRFAEDRISEASTLRTQLNIENDDILILFAGKLEHKKNPELLLQAFIELDSFIVDRPSSLEEQETKNKKQTNLHLLFVGNGELEEELKAKSRKQKEKLENQSFDCLPAGKAGTYDNKLEVDQGDSVKTENEKRKTNIHFMDFQNQTKMPVIYQACDLFCLPSQGPGETWGLAVNEAMAAGKAILVADKVGCAADLVNAENGMVFKSNDLDDLKQKLIALTKDKDMLQKMGKSAHQDIQNWSFEQQKNAILNYVNS